MFVKNKDQQAPAKADAPELAEKCREYLAGWQRAKADYENLKKETDRKFRDLAEFVTADLIMEILPIYDNLKLALAHSPAGAGGQEWLIGVSHIKKQFEDLLNKFKIKEIETVGSQFNPVYHEAVSYEDSDKPEGEILKELKSGYLLEERVMQPARVIVSKNKPADLAGKPADLAGEAEAVPDKSTNQDNNNGDSVA
ncbi:MAG TPA: nucleotide exchange factor GrpE [Patescibacteria group bacterium]|nr:nucleotide exchange factor GrpE [Patescibacteria group bacterium]